MLRLLATELTGPEIARQLFVSVNTLRTHTRHIFTKLDVTTRRAAVLRGGELHLLSLVVSCPSGGCPSVRPAAPNHQPGHITWRCGVTTSLPTVLDIAGHQVRPQAQEPS